MARFSSQGFFIGTIFLLIVSIIGLVLYTSFSTGDVSATQPITFWIIIGGISFGLYFIFKGVASSTTGINFNTVLIPLAVIALLIYLLIKQPNLIPSFSIAARKAIGMPVLVTIGSLAKMEARYEKW